MKGIPYVQYKVIFLGDVNVGKTSLICRYMYNVFDPAYTATIGIDFLSRTLYKDEQLLKLHFWDTAGQEKYKSLIHGYIRDSTIAIVVYDVTNRESFENLQSWIALVRKEAGNSVIVVIVANKIDLNRIVSQEEGMNRASEMEALYIETSAKTGENVKELYTLIFQIVPLLNTNFKIGDLSKGLALQPPKKVQRCSC